MAAKTSSKYDYITSKVLIQSGSPAVYQLTPKKETAGTLRRMILGEKGPAAGNKTILLVGETGTGKSTLINALVNYAMGVKWEDNVWFQIVEDRVEEELRERNQTESQTSDVIVYQIFGFEGKTLPFSLTIIDTPGYGDTRSIERDDIVKQRLFDLFRADDGVHEIDAVGLVLKASENRLTDRQRYIFHSALSPFGKDMEKNIVALITHSDGLTPENTLNVLKVGNVKCAKDYKNQPFHFMFNNCQRTQQRRNNKFALRFAWDLSEYQMSRLTDFLEKTTPQSVKTGMNVLSERIRWNFYIQHFRH